ncbi:MAG: hypothetical protein H6746_20520 [Deltaproteobacteria bacterium]|nr:hypothetical protein [Deltaproteobacteria bacterium]
MLFETTALTGSADPVLHLLRDDGAGVWTQVAFNDDYGNLNSRLSYTNPSASTNFLLVLRAFNSPSSGACDLKKDGIVQHASAPVGGWFTAASTFIFTSGDELRTVFTPGGSEVPGLLVKFSSYYLPSGVALANAPGGAAVLALSGNESHFLVGTPQVLDASGYHELRAGAAVVMANDVASDADGDGIGDALEAQLGTCGTLTGCGYNAESGLDTDRDGLFDGEEVFGVAGMLPGGVDDLPFARWGASPLKKDVFLEVDWLTSFGGPVSPGDSPFEWMRQHPTSPIGPWTGTVEAWVDKAREPYLAAPADHVKNPDGTDGIEVHFDLGVDPLVATDEAKFGAWSSGAPHALAADFVVKVSALVPGDVTVIVNGIQETFDATGLPPEWIALVIGFQALQTAEPIVVESLVVDDDTGVATLVLASDTPGLHFDADVDVIAGYEASVTTSREDDKSLYERYGSDSSQFDAVRRGRLRLAMITNPGGGGQTNGPRYVSGLAHYAMMHELGHSLGLQHWGHTDWGNKEVACIPHYRSFMNYALLSLYAFSATDAGFAINPAETIETETFGSAFDHSIFADAPYEYPSPPTATNGVDWNRNGTLDDASAAWRAMPLSQKDKSCAAFSTGRVNIATDEVVAGPIDLVRHGSRLYAVWSTGTAIKYKYASLGVAGSKSCTGTDDPTIPGGSCLTWSAVTTLTSGASYLGVTVASYGSEVYVAYPTDVGQLRVHRCIVSSSGPLTISGSWWFPTSSRVYKSDHAPELVIRHRNPTSTSPLGLLYLAQDGTFRSYGRVDATGSWSYEGALLDASDSAIGGAEAPVAKAWPDASVTGWSASEQRTLAILPDSSAAVRVYALNPSSNRWVNLGLELNGPQLGNPVTAAKPFLEYRLVRTSSGSTPANFAGHFMIGWMSDDPTWHSRARFRLSTLVDRTHPPSSIDLPMLEVAEAGDFLQNLWATTPYGTSASLYSDGTLDNVFGIVPIGLPSGTPGGWDGINFYPHADGSQNHDYSVYSDFRVMEDYCCKNLTGYGPLTCGAINVFD